MGDLNRYTQKLMPLPKQLTAPPIVDTSKITGTVSGLPNLAKQGSSLLSGIGGAFSSGSLNGAAGAAGKAIGSLIGGDYDAGTNGVFDAVGAIGSAIPGPYGAIISAGAGILGGLTNRMFGISTDEEALAATNEARNYYQNYSSDATNFDDIKALASYTGNTDVYKGGWFGGGTEAEARNEALAKSLANSKSYAENNQLNNVNNIAEDQIADAYANLTAFGGPLDYLSDDMPSVNYNFTYDEILNRKKKAEDKLNRLAFGGNLEYSGADFPSGLVHINSGGSHEENPNEGVQVGVDPEGVPNLVEEGEVIFDDYVFSNRIPIDDNVRERFHISKKKNYTFAEFAKKLENEIKERPNDPISKAGFKANISDLREFQEAIRQQERKEEILDEIASQEVADVENAIGGVPPVENVPIEEAPQEVSEIPIEQQEASAEELPIDENISANGGQLNRKNKFYSGGRKLTRAERKALQSFNPDWFRRKAKALGISEDDYAKFKYNPYDLEANLENFNEIYKTSRKNKAESDYIEAQKKARRNSLLNKGLYRYSDDESKLYKRLVAEDLIDGYINNEFNGTRGDDSKLIGFLSADDYNKLSDDKKSAYKRYKKKEGDILTDYDGSNIEDKITEEDFTNALNAYDKYTDGFKWDDTNFNPIEYPMDEIPRSRESQLRYAPAFAGAIGLIDSLVNPVDYSRAREVQRVSGTPMPMVTPSYIGDYLTYKPLDVLTEVNRLDANTAATNNLISNSVSPSKNAALLASNYNSQLALGDLFQKASEYNNARRNEVANFNRGTNQFNAQANMEAQRYNQAAKMHGLDNYFKGSLYATQMMDEIDKNRATTNSANLSNLLTSLGNIGEEAYDMDRLKWLEANDVLRSNYYNKSSKGGSLNRKKGGRK